MEQYAIILFRYVQKIGENIINNKYNKVLTILLIVLILCRGNLERISLILSSIGVCLGEMVFFSVNNIAVLLYVFIAIFLIKPYTRRIINEK